MFKNGRRYYMSLITSHAPLKRTREAAGEGELTLTF